MSVPLSAFVAKPGRSLIAASALGPIPMIKARWYRQWLKRRGDVLWIVIHCTAGAEGRKKAEDVAEMFRTLSIGDKKRSAHAVIDTDSIVQCVPWDSEAWAAGEQGNKRGEHFEFTGQSTQTTDEWYDALSLPMLQLGARLIADRCAARGLPPVFVPAEKLKLYEPGITTHCELTKAFGESTHTDPGPGFPMDHFVRAVQEAML